MTTWYPLLLIPTLHVKVWGGRRLASELGKTLVEASPYGEAWELHDTSTVANGAHAGQTLADLIAAYGTDIVGTTHNPEEGMPLLVKLLDAEAWLSVQVHPNDEQARELEGDPRGKTEAWIMLATEADAKLVIGVQPGTSREAMAQAIRDNTLEDLLAYAQVQAGDVLYMPANTVHAIGPGIVLYEVQQSSNVTYRLYDWGRMGLDGNPRELHIEKGVQVSNTEALPTVTHPDGEAVVAGTYFETRRYTLAGQSIDLSTEGHFHALTCIAGNVSLASDEHQVDLVKGATALIPAALSHYAISGEGQVLCSYTLSQ